MTSTNNIELNSDRKALRTPVSMEEGRDLDRRRAERTSAVNFDEIRYLDTRPTQHMTATWGD
jgi:hypothetical protein